MPFNKFHSEPETVDSIGVGELCKLIGIKNNQFEYWRRSLDPNAKRKKFFDSDVYCYLIMKKAILMYYFQVEDLKKLSWGFVFDACESIRPDELINLNFVIDPVNLEILLLNEKDKRPSPRAIGELREIPMSEIFEYLNTRRNRPRMPNNKITSSHDFFMARYKKNKSSK